MPLLKLVCIGGAALLLLTGHLSAQSIAGEYKCAGTSPGGAEYGGKVFIKPLESPLYTLAWDLGSGGSYTGTGVFEDGILAAAYGGGKPYGLVVYQVRGGKLKGRWLVGGQAGVGEESLEGPEGLEGTYTITAGKNTSGKPYGGKVAIAKNGETYTVKWTLPNESYSGVGILVGNTMVVGWGQDDGFGVVIYGQDGGNFKGKWASANDTKLGSETLTK